MAGNAVARIAIGVLMSGTVLFFVCVQIALLKEFARSRRMAHWMRLRKSHRVTFHRRSFVVHERAELVVIAPDAKQPHIPWRGRERAAAIALAAWELGRHLGR